MVHKEGWEREKSVNPLSQSQITWLENNCPLLDKIVETKPLVGGLVNYNHFIRAKTGDQHAMFALRIYQFPKRYYVEKQVLALINDQIPAPTCLFSSEGDSFSAQPYMLQSWVDGINLRTFAQNNPSIDHLSLLAHQLGKVLADIHRFSFKMFGFFGEDLELLESLDITPIGFVGYMNHFLTQRRVIKALGPVVSERLLNWVTKNSHHLTSINSTPCLTHMDFNYPNLFVNVEERGLTLSGVIDWEFAASATGLFDLANLLRYETSLDKPAVKELIRSYINHGGQLPDNWEVLVRLLDSLSLCSLISEQNVNDVAIGEMKKYFLSIVE